jgi:sigma-B regulation protein RsbQ
VRGYESAILTRAREGFLTAVQRNNVNVIGSGQETLIFAHGYGCDQNMWRHVTPAFQERYRIVLFDYVGSCLSDASSFDRNRYSTLRGYALDVVEILNELNLTNVHFVGHSVSSMIGALVSIEQPAIIQTITMIGPSACYINSGDYFGGFEREDIEGLLKTLESNHVAWSATMAPAIMGNPEVPELSAELEASFCRMDPFLASHFARVTFLSDNRADLPHVMARTLVLQCQNDVIAGLRVGEYVHKCLPNSEFVVLDATGHCPHMSAPKEVIQELRRFLQ